MPSKGEETRSECVVVHFINICFFDLHTAHSAKHVDPRLDPRFVLAFVLICISAVYIFTTAHHHPSLEVGVR